MIQTLFGAVEPEPTLFDRLKAGVQKTRGQLQDVFAGRTEIDDELLEELEYALITADVGVRTVTEILDRVRKQKDPAEVRRLIREHLLEVLPTRRHGSLDAAE